MSRRWTEEEEEMVLREWPSHGDGWPEWERLLPGRSRGAIRGKAHSMHLIRDNRWTPEEDRVLLRAALVVRRATGRSAYAMANRLRYLAEVAGERFR